MGEQIKINIQESKNPNQEGLKTHDKFLSDLKRDIKREKKFAIFYGTMIATGVGAMSYAFFVIGGHDIRSVGPWWGGMVLTVKGLVDFIGSISAKKEAKKELEMYELINELGKPEELK